MKVGDNYAFNKLFNNSETYAAYNDETATYKGVGVKTLVLLGITFVVTLAMIGTILSIGTLSLPIYLIAFIVSLVISFAIGFSPRRAQSLAIPYAFCEGIMLGSIIGILEVIIPNQGLVIASTALMVTISIFIAALFLYTTGIIRVGGRFLGIILTVILGFGIFFLGYWLLSLILLLTGNPSLFVLYFDSNLSLVVSIVLCIAAAIYVIFSLDEANQIVQGGYAKNYEWYAAYAIAVNVVYLFLEVLRLVIIIFVKSDD